jgi:hypothetical protein
MTSWQWNVVMALVKVVLYRLLNEDFQSLTETEFEEAVQTLREAYIRNHE